MALEVPAGALAVAAVLAASGCTAQGKNKTAEAGGAPVNVLEVRRVELRREVEAVGTLAARDQTVVSAEVGGRVARLAADMGDRVTAGTPLVVLDAEKLKSPSGRAAGGARDRLGRGSAGGAISCRRPSRPPTS